MDIIVKKGPQMRGQAHVVFQDTPEATSAMRALQGFPLYGKPIKIQYSKNKSMATKRLEEKIEELETGGSDEAAAAIRPPQNPKRTRDNSDDAPPPSQKKQKSSSTEAEISEEEESGQQEPSNILFLQELNAECTKEVVTYLFKQYPGFVEVRIPPHRHDIAFVEFESEHQAMRAQTALQGFQLNEAVKLKISFAKA
eukprot:Partr_v1_DN24663_c1_g1_i2_m59681 putative small nuclear ribonucleoprotein